MRMQTVNRPYTVYTLQSIPYVVGSILQVLFKFKLFYSEAKSVIIRNSSSPEKDERKRRTPKFVRSKCPQPSHLLPNIFELQQVRNISFNIILLWQLLDIDHPVFSKTSLSRSNIRCTLNLSACFGEVWPRFKFALLVDLAKSVQEKYDTDVLVRLQDLRFWNSLHVLFSLVGYIYISRHLSQHRFIIISS